MFLFQINTVLSINQRILNIDNNHKCLLNHHIRVIPEGSCDSEDWSNDADITIYSHRQQLF